MAIVSTNVELRRSLADACERLGYPTEPAPDGESACESGSGPVLWDIPVLAPGERITDDTLAALDHAREAGVRIAYAADPGLATLRVTRD